MRITELNLSKYNRVFTFGCSYTNYIWPTWADIIGREVPVYENWGKSGGGNSFIVNSVIECHTTHKFQKGDLVLIMWSSLSREDRYINGSWLCVGGIGHQTVYSKDWVKKFGLDMRGYAIRDYANILLIQNLLENLECDYDQYSMHHLLCFDHSNVDRLFPDLEYRYNLYRRILIGINKSGTIIEEGKTIVENQDVVELYKTIFPKIHLSIQEIVYDNFWKTRLIVNFGDTHPSPSEHLLYLDRLYPNNSISQSTREYVEQYDCIVRNTNSKLEENIHTPSKIVRL